MKLKPGYNPISRYEHLAGIAGVKDEKVIVDCSCGNGEEGRVICQRYRPYMYLGIDIDEGAISRAKNMYIPGKGICEFSVGDIREPAPISADYYFCVETLEHLPVHENSKVAKAIMDSLVPGGLLLISVPGNPKIAMEDKRHKQIITKDVILDMFKDLSFFMDDRYIKFFGRPEAYSTLYVLKKEGGI